MFQPHLVDVEQPGMAGESSKSTVESQSSHDFVDLWQLQSFCSTQFKLHLLMSVPSYTSTSYCLVDRRCILVCRVDWRRR